MKSIRRTLLTRLAVGALALLAVGTGCLYVGVKWLLTDQFDAAMSARIATFATSIEQEGSLVELTFSEESMPEFGAHEAPEYLELWLAGGAVGWRSPSLAAVDLPHFFGPETAPLHRDLVLPDGRAGRAVGAEIVVKTYEPAEDDPGPARIVLVLARSREPLDRALGYLLGGTAGGILLLLGGGWFLGRSAVERGLRPLDDFARHVEAIDDPLRTQPFPVQGVPRELRPLTDEHNQLLERVRVALERERRTTANIAHELRTPVAELVILADVAARCADDPVETARALGQLHELGQQMRNLITTLLELANIESGRIPLEAERIDLAAMVRDCWRPLAEPAEEKGQVFHEPARNGCSVHVDRAALSIVLTNLLSNAVEYAPREAEIRCAIENGAAGCALVVSNPANGLGAEDLGKLSEPFWRASSSREDRTHAGIGLALGRRLAELLELELSFAIQDGTFRARLDFPPPRARDVTAS